MDRQYSTVTGGKAFTGEDFAIGVVASLLMNLCLLIFCLTLAGPELSLLLMQVFVPGYLAGPEHFEFTLAFAIGMGLPLLVNAGAILALRRRRPGTAWGLLATPAVALVVILLLTLLSPHFAGLD